MLILGGCSNRSGRVSEERLRFALPTADWWTAAPFIVDDGASFNKAGLKVETLEVASGLASKNAVVAGTVDIGLSAATPLVSAASKAEDVVVSGTYLRSTKIIGIIRPTGGASAIRPPEPIAIVPSTISESFLYEYLTKLGHQRAMESKQISLLHSRPADIPSALKSGSAKSAVVWEPFLTLGAEQSGLTAVTDAVDFEVNLYLIARASVVNRRQEGSAASFPTCRGRFLPRPEGSPGPNSSCC
ncbi:MAG: ABC transporter substrate-binding protein [Bryobacterales bacterium]|nr:ABC transporter substrate-binding protein [Bryobacterales bacterium]